MRQHGRIPDNLHASEPGMKLSPVGSLARLLVDLFSTAPRIVAFARSYKGMEALAKDLPGDNVPVSEMGMALARCAVAGGHVDREFFEELTKLQPKQTIRIRRVAEEWGIDRIAGKVPIFAVGKRREWTVGPLLGALAIACYVRASVVPEQQAIPDGTIRLGRHELDPMTLTVVSARTGKAWAVVLSRHRTAKSAARDIFFATQLEDSPHAARALADDRYKLCQDGTCYEDELVGQVVSPGRPVRIWRSQMGQMSVPDLSMVQCTPAQFLDYTGGHVFPSF